MKNSVVKKNLMGVSESMSKKDWKDSQGRKGKVPPPLFFTLTQLLCKGASIIRSRLRHGGSLAHDTLDHASAPAAVPLPSF